MVFFFYVRIKKNSDLDSRIMILTIGVDLLQIKKDINIFFTYTKTDEKETSIKNTLKN